MKREQLLEAKQLVLHLLDCRNELARILQLYGHRKTLPAQIMVKQAQDKNLGAAREVAVKVSTDRLLVITELAIAASRLEHAFLMRDQGLATDAEIEQALATFRATVNERVDEEEEPEQAEGAAP